MVAQDFLEQEELVVAHLFWVASAIQLVTLNIAGRAISGRMLPPDADTRAVVFEPTPGQELPERSLKKGKFIRARYASLDDEYAFKSQILEVGPAIWLLSIPRDITRNDRRMLTRKKVNTSGRYTIGIHRNDGVARRLLIHDLSPAGMCFVFDPKLDRFEEGTIHRGDVHIPGQDELVVRFQIISIRTLGDDSSQRLVGCRFQGLGFSGCAEITKALQDDE
jgi:c-di-GMP-binding flagellar brake protein YcgR